jgi:DNA helicase II / ATP-dependent DNA helicase PcrA
MRTHDVPTRFILFDAGDAAELGRRLNDLAVSYGVSFMAPRPITRSRGIGRTADPAVPRATASGEPLTAKPNPGAAGPRHAAAGEAVAGTGERRRDGRLGPPVPVWQWSGSAADLRAEARHVLNHFVYPLVAAGEPFCVAFPFAAEVLDRRALDVSERRLLDLEDIGALLAAGAPPALEPIQVAAAALQGLDPDQRAAASHGAGPARVLAAAGSGKTKTMVARVAALVARGTPPGHVLLLAFNAEAALQLEERLASAGVPTTRRIDKSAAGVHCSTFNAFGYRFQQQVLGGAPSVATVGAAQEKLLRLVMAQEKEGSLIGEPPGRQGSRRADDPYDAALTDAAFALARTLDSWRAELIPAEDVHRTAVSRYDQLQKSRGVQTFDDQVLATVCALLAAPERRRLLQEIYHFVLVDEFQDVNPVQQALLDLVCRPWRNLFVVGDDDQLIYGWRSARAESIIDFGAELPAAPHTAYYTLPTNYRCSQEVVARAEQLVVNNRVRAGKSMRARPSAPCGSVLFAAAAGPRELCKEVAAFLVVERLRLACDWSDLAVLARFRAQLAAARGGLRDLSIPMAAMKPPVVLDPRWSALVHELLCAAAHDRDLRHLSATTVLERVATGLPAADETAQSVLDAARLLACDHTTPAGLAGAWHRLAGGAGRASSDTGSGSSGAREDGVTLATIHSTKGREYASVVIVDFAPALQPLSPGEREEERRVLYVALTRAKHAALLTVSRGDGPSHPFLLELARPPQRSECRALRRDLSSARDRLAACSGEIHPAVQALLREITANDSGSVRDGRQVTDASLGETAALLLRARSRLLERRLFAASPAARLLKVLR